MAEVTASICDPSSALGKVQDDAPISANAVALSQDPVTASVSSILPIILRSPLRYKSPVSSPSKFTSPPPEWLVRSWTVTHSTLPMWRKAKNVRISYKILSQTTPELPVYYEDEVCSEPVERTFLPQPKSIKGVCTPAGEAAWDWRGKGWLKIATSHWELLGWGNRDGEMWAVTWFAPSIFTPAGLDIYWFGEGRTISDGLYKDILIGLEGLEAKEVAELAKRDMKEVKID